MTETTNRGPEYQEVQKPAIELLCGHLGYEYALGSDLAGERASESEVLLTRRLSKKLLEINAGITEVGVKQAVTTLQLPLAMGLLEANEKLHCILSRWVTVDEIVRGQPVGRSVRYIDYENPQNNEFLVVEELTVKGSRYPRRLDLTVFVNGIPVVVIECKDSAAAHGIEKATQDLLLYQEIERGVARLFHTVQLCIGLRKRDARYGTILTPPDRYAGWSSAYPLSESDLQALIGRKPTAQDVLLAGMLAKPNLLDLIRSFVSFDRQGGKTVKKVARYQQFEAVNATVARIVAPNSSSPMRERGGVVWHTQGSGKSLSMLWLSMKLRRTPELNNPTILIVSDRRDLDRQIHEAFLFCGFENPVRASRVSHLRKLLNGPSGQTIMATVQKFRDELDLQQGSRHPVLCERDNLIVLIDEAHRTEYGVFNAHLRRALPNACLVAFTGTPIEKTVCVFGSYIHKYTMPQSIADGATVPIYYESRLPQLSVWGKQIDPMFDALFSAYSRHQVNRFKVQEVTEQKIALASGRIEQVAFDIYEHYRTNFEADGFKAQVATCSQEAAGRYYEELSKYLPDRVALLITQPASKDSRLHELRKPFEDEDAIIDQFKNEGADKLAMIIVVDKYLTGFDAPILRVLYLDKPLKEHNLLQAIARVNRPLPEMNKEWGLIVDYWGVSRFLDKALQTFSQDLSAGDVLAMRDEDGAYQALRLRRAEVFALFPGTLNRRDIEPWLWPLEKEDAQARFLNAYRAFYNALERLLPNERALDYLGDFAWLRRIRREMVTQYSMEDLGHSEVSRRVQELIDRHVKSESVEVLLEKVPILSDQFTAELGKLGSARSKASRIEHAISRTITMKVAEDPAYYGTLRERLEKIIEDRRQARIDDTREYQLLLNVRETLTEGGAKSAKSLGLTEDTFAIYGLLKIALDKNLYIAEEANGQAKSLSQDLTQVIEKEAVIDWPQKEDVQREMRRQIKRQLRLAEWPKEKLEQTTNEIMDLARARFAR